MIRLLACIVAIGLFSALAAYSYGKYVAKPYLDLNVGYSKSERDGMAKLIKRSTAKSKPPISGDEQRAALLSLWGDGQ